MSNDKAQKDSQGVSQHKRMAMGAKLDGKKLGGTAPATKPVKK